MRNPFDPKYDEQDLSLTEQLLSLQWTDSLADLSERRQQEAGPNEWGSLTDDDYGSEYDYEILDQGERWIYYPVCNASTQWAYRFLPEHSFRWGIVGFIIEQPLEAPYSKALLDKLWNDGLKSEWDRAAENDEQARQGE